MTGTKLRFISALVLVLFLSLLIYLFELKGFLGFLFLVILGSQWEYHKLCLNRLHSLFLASCFVLSAFCICLVNAFFSEYLSLLLAFCLMSSVSFLLFYRRSKIEIIDTQNFIAYSVLGYLYLGLLSSYAIKILLLDNGPRWFFLMLLCVVASDSCAYFVGRKFGKRKILESVSPNKTLEGSIGGLLGASAVTTSVSSFIVQTEWWMILIFSFLAALSSQFGDLFESMLKRNAQQKDSGNILPGHGGILDRIDGILFALPVFYFLARFSR